MSDSLSAAPAVPWATEAIELVFTQESSSVANHSVRSWAFARLLRDHLDLVGEVDESLLLAGTVLHDIGLRRDTRKPVRFEIDGADRAAEFLTAQGLGANEVDRVWEAIALHTSDGIPERRGPLAMLVRAGIGIDLGFFTDIVPNEQAAASPTTSSNRCAESPNADQAIHSAPRWRRNGQPHHISPSWNEVSQPRDGVNETDNSALGSSNLSPP